MRLLLIALPCFIGGLLSALFVTAAVAGFLWLYVYGDGNWPPLAAIVIGFAFVFSWVLSGILMTTWLKHRHWVQRMSDWQLAAMSLILSLLVVALLLLHQWGIGNLDPPHPCVVSCKAKGHDSSMVEYDEQGREVCTCL